MKVLFCIGYQKTAFSPQSWKETGSGGSEYSVMKLAERFSELGHEVMVSGEVITGTYNGVKYFTYEDLGINDHYDVVIATNYIHYLQELDSKGITFDKSYFWIHNNEFYPWWNGSSLDQDGRPNLHNSRMNRVIAVSDYSKNQLLNNYPEMESKIDVIPNAIDSSDWPSPQIKIKDRFIYSSAADRGLENLLSMWGEIKQIKPNATLLVATPPYAEEWYDGYKKDLDGVEFVGALPPSRLYNEISKSEYWVYPSYYDETYCITALEMMKGGVKIISSDTANLKSLLQGKGKLVSSDQDFDKMKLSILDILQTDQNNPNSMESFLRVASGFANKQSWEMVGDIWLSKIEEDDKPKRVLHQEDKLHPELYTYYENPTEWKRRFITYSARTKEWDLITDEPFMNTFTFPLFTPEFCKMIREEAEHSNSWTYNRHEHYPTTDMVLQTIGMHEIYMEVLREYVMPLSIYMWALEGEGWDVLDSENFLARYTPDTQGHLSIHHDASDVTCLVQLSDLDEYEGGGTWFRRQKELVKNGIGYVTIHPGNITHKHGARAVSDGKRYIIVSFMKNTKR
jgi:glycosyltransferase involved in cell wall biosynthesis